MKAEIVYVKKRERDYDFETGVTNDEIQKLPHKEWEISSEPGHTDEDLWEKFILIPVEED